jgi:GNAT superfamily N-acetyltransferase
VTIWTGAVSPLNQRIVSLADHRQLVGPVGALRWREWGEGAEDAASWIELPAREAGRDELPVTLVATGPAGEVCGAVGLAAADGALAESERAGRGPWLVGLAVEPAHRLRQVGRSLVSSLEQLAMSRGHQQLWVATGPQADDFYRRCGWIGVQVLRLGATGQRATILNRKL